MNDCDFADEINLCKPCREDLCVWITNLSRVVEWAQERQLPDVPNFTMGVTTLEVKEILSQNRKKCFRYAAKLVCWGYLLGKNCRREHYTGLKKNGKWTGKRENGPISRPIFPSLAPNSRFTVFPSFSIFFRPFSVPNPGAIHVAS
jgi:hypothetical protein